MKTILSLLCVLGLGFAVNAADVTATMPLPGVATSLIAPTNAFVAVSTSSWYTVSAPNSSDLAFFVDMKFLNAVSAGDVNALTFRFQRGIDVSTFESNTWQTVVFAANATTTTANSTCTNLNVAGVPYLRFRIENNSTNSHATNITVSVNPKLERVKTQ